MILFRLTKAEAPFNCGSSNIGVSIEIRGTFSANDDLLQRFKKAKSRRDILNQSIYFNFSL